MSMMVSFVLSFFPRDVLDEILNLIESVSEDFPSYSCQIDLFHILCAHAYIGQVARYFSIIGEPLQRWGKRILSH